MIPGTRALRRRPVAWLGALLGACALASATGATDSATSLVPYRQGKLWGYARRTGEIALPPVWDKAGRFVDGLARVSKGGKWGYVDTTGRAVVPLAWDSLGPFAEGLAPACGDTGVATGVTEGVGRERRPVSFSACGFVDRVGKVVVPLRYTGVNWMAAGVAQVRVHRECPCLVATQWGLVDAQGREVLPVDYCFVSPPSEGLVKVIYEEPSLEVRRFGFRALDGREVLPKLPYDGSHEAWSEGRIGVRRAGKFGFIDHAGHEVIPLRFDSAYPFREGLAAVSLDGRWGFVDARGELVVAAEYDEVESFQEGLAWVRRGDRAGFVDAHGRVVVPLEFDGRVDRQERPYWSQGLRGMKAVDGGWGFIDRQGRWVVPPDLEWVRPCTEGRCAARRGGLWGFFDLGGRLVIPHRYQRLETTFEDGLAFVSRRLRADLPHFANGYIDASGREFFDEPPLF